MIIIFILICPIGKNRRRWSSLGFVQVSKMAAKRKGASVFCSICHHLLSLHNDKIDYVLLCSPPLFLLLSRGCVLLVHVSLCNYFSQCFWRKPSAVPAEWLFDESFIWFDSVKPETSRSLVNSVHEVYLFWRCGDTEKQR